MRHALLASLALLGAASAATFAGFTIKPHGDQKVSLATGVTTLASGGVATDAKRGVTVDAKYIEYKDGDFLNARTAKLTTREGGVLTGSKLAYDAKTGRLAVTGDIRYSDGQVKGLDAETMTLDLNRKVVVATGGVKSATPAMSADRVVVDADNNRAVMYGNYRYNYGATRLSSSKANAVLFVTWNAQGKPSVSTKPTAEQLAPYQSYLK